METVVRIVGLVNLVVGLCSSLFLLAIAPRPSPYFALYLIAGVLLITGGVSAWAFLSIMASISEKLSRLLTTKQ
jgi:hypothetical protein